jgi:hypothetical protein
MLTLGALAAIGLFAGCKPQGDVYSYDPKVDSLVPPAVAAVDMSILDDQKARPRPSVPESAAPAGPATRGAASPASAPAPEPGAAPTAPTAPGTTPPPPVPE